MSQSILLLICQKASYKWIYEGLNLVLLWVPLGSSNHGACAKESLKALPHLYWPICVSKFPNTKTTHCWQSLDLCDKLDLRFMESKYLALPLLSPPMVFTRGKVARPGMLKNQGQSNPAGELTADSCCGANTPVCLEVRWFEWCAGLWVGCSSFLVKGRTRREPPRIKWFVGIDARG